VSKEYTNPEKWSCDMCVYYFPWNPETMEESNRISGTKGIIGSCRYNPEPFYLQTSNYWCGKFELNRAHPKAGFSELYKNEYNKEQKMFKMMLEYYKGEE
jgi:hypothetical protein